MPAEERTKPLRGCVSAFALFKFYIFHKELQYLQGDTGERYFERETCVQCLATSCFKPVHFVLCVVEQDASFKLKYFQGKL